MKKRKIKSKSSNFLGMDFSDGEQNKLSRPLTDVKENLADKTLAKLKQGNGSMMAKKQMKQMKRRMMK